MMKKWLALMIALAALAASSFAEDRVTTTEEAELRKGPGADYRIIDVIEEGTRLTYDRTSRDADSILWYRVRVDGRAGWLSALQASTDAADGEDVVTTTNDAKLRSGPGSNYASRLVIGAGTTLEYDGIAEDDDDMLWYHVSFSGKKGWISSRAARQGVVSITGSVVTAGEARLRSGAGEVYGARTAIPGGVNLDYDRMETDERGVTWYRVEYGALRGWVSSLNVRGPAGDPLADNRIRTLGIVRLRYRPDRDSVSMQSIRAGVTLFYDRTAQDDQGITWYHVSCDGLKGWVSSRYTEVY